MTNQRAIIPPPHLLPPPQGSQRISRHINRLGLKTALLPFRRPCRSRPIADVGSGGRDPSKRERRGNGQWTGAAKRVDNVGVAGGAGVLAGSAAGLASGPTAPAVGPAVGFTVGVGVGAAYSDSGFDKFWDKDVDSTLGVAEPYLAAGARQVVQGISQLSGWASSA